MVCKLCMLSLSNGSSQKLSTPCETTQGIELNPGMHLHMFKDGNMLDKVQQLMQETGTEATWTY